VSAGRRQGLQTEAGVVARSARRPYLDNLKVVLVSAVILGHVFITYGDIGSWAYRETSDNDAFLIVAALVVSLGSLFAMGLFFLIAGLLTPRSLAKKGTGGFLRDRVVRLGVPFLAYLVIYPLVVWLAGDEGWREVLGDQARELTPGPLWFVLVLLIYSACYAWWRRGHAARSDGGALRPRLLVLLGALIAASTVVVRLVFPINSDQVFSLHLWQWPQCLGLFVLGVMCAENGWADPVADRLRRGCGFSALAGVVVMVGAFAASPESFEPFAGGLQWQALLTAVCEATIAVALSVWLLGFFQRHVDRSSPLRMALGRAAFGAYVVQVPVVVAVALAFAALPLAPEVKFLFVAPLSLIACFGLAWGLTRLPGVRRVG
jgi:surface polysaccharide O-acyltransferase-like enzyme